MANYNDFTIQNVKEYLANTKDMPTFVNACRLSVYFSLCLTVSSLYLPLMKSQTGSKRNRNLPVPVNMAAEAPSLHHNKGQSDQEERHSLHKRGLNAFSTMMTRHANKHKNDQIFVDRMFKLFDLDGDRVINRREFKLVLQILRIVDHNF